MSKLVNIQILRALAAFTVVLYHVGVEKAHICTDAGRVCGDDMWFGLDGVKLFFMISGFIMVVTSWNNFGKPAAAWDFMRRRLQRIVPLYWIITTLAVVGIAFAPSMLSVPVLDPLYIAASYLFYPVTRLNGLVRPIANLGWTLELEMMFYVVFSGALFFNRKLGMALAISFLVLFSGARVAGLYGASVPLNFWGDPIILDFVMGMLVGALYMNGTALPKSGIWASTIAFAALTAGVFYISPWIDSYPETHLVPRLVVALPAAAIFILGALGPQLDSSKLLTRGGLLLGDASYSLYLVHPLVLRPFAKVWTQVFGSHLPIWVFTAVAPFAAIVSGLLLYWLVEKPLTNLFAKKKLTPLVSPATFATTATPR